jgi:hypothetical protein
MISEAMLRLEQIMDLSSLTLTLSPTYQNEILHDPCHLVVPLGASKMISEPTLRSAQIVHIS